MPRIAFVMDPISTLSLKKDSTLAMIKAAQARGWPVAYLEQQDIYLDAGQVLVDARSLSLVEPFASSLDPADAQQIVSQAGSWYELGDALAEPLSNFDIVMMRKDPPFDMEYVYSTYLLERAEADGVLVANKPQSLRDCNEKFFATNFPQCCPPLVVSRREDVLTDFQRRYRNVVFKRLDGMGGMSVFRVMDGDVNLRVILETLTLGGREQIMGQLYLPEITDGDKRILLIDGEPIDYALARIPMEGELRGNLAAGATGVGRALTERDRWIASEVGPELKARGLLFVGIDVIGDYLTEINVTCPTCIRELDAQFSLDIAGMLLDTLEGKIAS